MEFTQEDRATLHRIDHKFDGLLEQVAGHQKTLYGHDGRGGIVQDMSVMQTTHAQCPNAAHNRRSAPAAAGETQPLEWEEPARKPWKARHVVYGGGIGAGVILVLDLLKQVAQTMLAK